MMHDMMNMMGGMGWAMGLLWLLFVLVLVLAVVALVKYVTWGRHLSGQMEIDYEPHPAPCRRSVFADRLACDGRAGRCSAR
jgi:hypothetical protein